MHVCIQDTSIQRCCTKVKTKELINLVFLSKVKRPSRLLTVLYSYTYIHSTTLCECSYVCLYIVITENHYIQEQCGLTYSMRYERIGLQAYKCTQYLYIFIYIYTYIYVLMYNNILAIVEHSCVPLHKAKSILAHLRRRA